MIFKVSRFLTSMKKLFLLLGLLVLLVGCTQVEIVQEQEVIEPEVVKETPKPVKVIVSRIPDEIQDVLDKKNNAKSLIYDYQEDLLRIKAEIYHTALKGNTMKLEIPPGSDILNTMELDTVIFDIPSGKGTGYCASEKYCITTGEMGPVDFTDYYQQTPFDWLSQITEAEKIVEENLQNRKVWKVLVNGEDFYWIDTYYGIPLRVENQGTVYEYDNMLFNKVSDEDLIFTLRK